MTSAEIKLAIACAWPSFTELSGPASIIHPTLQASLMGRQFCSSSPSPMRMASIEVWPRGRRAKFDLFCQAIDSEKRGASSGPIRHISRMVCGQQCREAHPAQPSNRARSPSDPPAEEQRSITSLRQGIPKSADAQAGRTAQYAAGGVGDNVTKHPHPAYPGSPALHQAASTPSSPPPRRPDQRRSSTHARPAAGTPGRCPPAPFGPSRRRSSSAAYLLRPD